MQAGEHGSAVSALYKRVRASVDATPASAVRTRARIIFAVIAIVALTTLLVAAASEIVYGRQAVGLEVGVLSTARLAWTGALLIALTAGATVIALRRDRSGLGSAPSALVFVAATLVPAYAVLTTLVPLHAPGSGVDSVQISPFGWRCFVVASLVGIAALASFAIALRRAVPVAARARGAALGAAAGAWAGLSVFVFCPSGDQLHLAIGHVLPMMVLTLLGAVALTHSLRT
jgi:hypothetical protein